MLLISPDGVVMIARLLNCWQECLSLWSTGSKVTSGSSAIPFDSRLLRITLNKCADAAMCRCFVITVFKDRLFHMCMQLPVPLISVSTAIQDILFHEFGRLSLIVPNGIDCDKFRPDGTEPRSKLQFVTNGVQASCPITATCSVQ